MDQTTIQDPFVDAVRLAQIAIETAHVAQRLVDPAWQRLAELSVEADLGNPDPEAEEVARKQIADGELAARKLPLLQARLTEALQAYKADRLAKLRERTPEFGPPVGQTFRAVQVAEEELICLRKAAGEALFAQDCHRREIDRMAGMAEGDLLRRVLCEAGHTLPAGKVISLVTHTA